MRSFSLYDFGSLHTIQFLIDSTGTPSGVTECDQLSAICKTYNGTFRSKGTGAETICICTTEPINLQNECFEDNKLYVEGALPLTYSLDQCFNACQNVDTCQVKSHTKQEHMLPTRKSP